MCTTNIYFIPFGGLWCEVTESVCGLQTRNAE